jgi:hypothetical protein
MLSTAVKLRENSSKSRETHFLHESQDEERKLFIFFPKNGFIL